MTLIATVWSSEGFAIAADGLEVFTDRRGETGDVQKIFSTPFSNGTGFAWAWVGCVRLEFVSGRSYDLREITQRVMANLPSDACLENPESYFDRIANGIFYELPSEVDFPHLTDDEVIFVGYLAGKPVWREIIFQHRESAFFPPVVTEPKVPLGDFYAFTGSPTIRDQMHAVLPLSRPVNLEEAVTAVRTFAEVCVESPAEECRNFGGSAHTAVVTTSGFSWISGPIGSGKEG